MNMILRTILTFAVCGILFLLVASRELLLQGGEASSPKKAVQAIADALAKGDAAGAKKIAAEFVKHEKEPIHEAMETFEPRVKGGFGVGNVPGAIFPDGIEKRIQAIAKDGISMAKLKKESEALVEMAQRVAAMSQITDLTPPKAKQDLWMQYSKTMGTAAGGLLKAIKSGDTAEVRMATTKLNTNCINCHLKFR